MNGRDDRSDDVARDQDRDGRDGAGDDQATTVDESSRPGRDRWLARVGAIVAATVGLAVVAAAGLGAAGAGGAGAAVGLLLVLALGCGVAALIALATAAIDEFRGRSVTLHRPVLGVVLLVASVAFTIMAVGAL